MGNELTVSINGRVAIPVRAIPYITGWKSSPDDVAQQLARKVGAPFEKFPNTLAYRLTAGVPAKILPKQWDDIVAQLEALEADIRSRHSNESKGYAEWLGNSVAKLPAGVFVWFDEFANDKPFGKGWLGSQRDGDNELVTAPLLTNEQRKIIFEEFERYLVAERPTDKADSRKVRQLPKPDWSEWSYMPNVMLWQACALSMNLDPHSMAIPIISRPSMYGDERNNPAYLWHGNFASLSHREEFIRRLRIIKANRDERNHFPQRRPYGSGATQNDSSPVRLLEFARWAVSVVKWDNLPAEFVALVQATEIKTPDIEAMGTVGTEIEAPKEGKEISGLVGSEPRLQRGNNKRAAVDAWVKCQARSLVKPEDKGEELAERIRLEADRWGYGSARAPLTVPTIIKMLPPGITGGRGKNRGKRKN